MKNLQSRNEYYRIHNKQEKTCKFLLEDLYVLGFVFSSSAFLCFLHFFSSFSFLIVFFFLIFLASCFVYLDLDLVLFFLLFFVFLNSLFFISVQLSCLDVWSINV